jgi:ribosomal protein L40E
MVGTGRSALSPSDDRTSELLCLRCGAASPGEANLCRRCGAPLRGNKGKPFEPISERGIELFYFLGGLVPCGMVIFGLTWGFSRHPQRRMHGDNMLSVFLGAVTQGLLLVGSGLVLAILRR